MRLFALSDLHVDYAENDTWVRSLSRQDYRDDVLLLGGDLSSDLPRLEDCLQRLRERFDRVFFVPGNHDLWVRKGDGQDSLGRAERIGEIAQRSGVETRPARIKSLRIVPLLSWYDFSFGQPGEELRRRWADFRLCVWPAGMELGEVARYFHQQNTIEAPLPGETVISFSHFMPRPDALPERVVRQEYFLLPVLGSTALEDQVRVLKPRYHVFGHSHLNSVRLLNGTTYLNNAFGYPAEHRFTRKALVELPLAG